MSFHYWISEAEIERREQRIRDKQEHLEQISKHNDGFVGELKEYKGIKYQMKQRGTYSCLELPPLSGLDGEFTSTAALHQIIDNLERQGNLPPSK